jgi:hypothetical protein
VVDLIDLPEYVNVDEETYFGSQDINIDNADVVIDGYHIPTEKLAELVFLISTPGHTNLRNYLISQGAEKYVNRFSSIPAENLKTTKAMSVSRTLAQILVH